MTACHRRFGFWPTHRWCTVAEDGSAFKYQECLACFGRRIVWRKNGGWRRFPMQSPWLEGGSFDSDFRRAYGI